MALLYSIANLGFITKGFILISLPYARAIMLRVILNLVLISGALAIPIGF